ncbi:hypothetical protein BUALT_Bualt03G0218700 [Buddleja alternifolia]|uniref:Uncharacterized protein n=1 Tax=Buddleja alternifolia TaxID=168488 RepID=A0AAV6Y725_9LAMI|nr:hypothetical protein BUALT_Bualt03G0218700 [Buddleja alternifolia]
MTLPSATQELELAKAYESKGKEDIASLQENVSMLEDAKLKLKEEVNAKGMKELCNDLEAKLKQSDDNFVKSGHVITTANLKKIELGRTLQTLSITAKEAKSQLRESETRSIAVEQRVVELEQLLNLEELKSHDYQRELREISEKFSEINGDLKKVVEEKQQLGTQLQDFESKVTQLESELGKLAVRNSELEIELKNAIEKSSEHEGRVNTIHQQSIKLENLFQTSDLKVVDAGKKVSELELLLETEKYRIKELEEQISLLENNCENVEAEASKSGKKVSKLEAELENEKQSEAENLLNILRDELNISQQKLESIKNDLKATGIREDELLNTLKLAEEKLEQQSQLLEKANARSTELESSQEPLTRDLDLKIQEAISNFTNRDTEAKVLYEKAQVLENEINSYQEQLASHMNTTTEWTENHSKVSELHSVVEARVSEAETRLEEALLKCNVKSFRS